LHTGPWKFKIPYRNALGLRLGPHKYLGPCNVVLGTGRRRSGRIPANRRPGPARRGQRATCGVPRLDSNRSLGRWWRRRGRAAVTTSASAVPPAPVSSRPGQTNGRHGELSGGLGSRLGGLSHDGRDAGWSSTRPCQGRWGGAARASRGVACVRNVAGLHLCRRRVPDGQRTDRRTHVCGRPRHVAGITSMRLGVCAAWEGVEPWEGTTSGCVLWARTPRGGAALARGWRGRRHGARSRSGVGQLWLLLFD
jgi:hypothetical protein